MAADESESSEETRHLGPQDRPGSDGSGETFQAFLDVFWRERESGRTRTLRDYFDAFPGHEEAIAEVFVGARKQTPTAEGMVGPYRLVRSLSSGGQGEVFVAEDTRVKHRRVALKLIRRDRLFDPRDQLRMRREAEALSALDDPGICTVHELGEHEGSHYIAMQLIEGQTLGDLISTARMRSRSTRRGSPETEAFADFEDEDSDGTAVADPVPHSRDEIDDILRLFERAARSLHTAHEAGIIHRDLKPGNLMVRTNGSPVVIDFGLARAEDAETVTRPMEIVGTFDYMSPEQYGGKDIMTLDRRTDVFSLGVTLYEYLTLHHPFAEATAQARRLAILSKDPPDPRRFNPAIPRDLRVVLETALDKDRNRRYRTALGLAEDIDRVRKHEPIVAKPAGIWTKVVRWSQRNPAVAVLSTMLVLGLSSTLALTLRENATRRRSEQAALRAQRAEAERSEQLAVALDHSRAQELTALAGERLDADPGLALKLAVEASHYHRLPAADAVMQKAMDRMLEIRTIQRPGWSNSVPVNHKRNALVFAPHDAFDLETGARIFFPSWPEDETYVRLLDDFEHYLTTRGGSLVVRTLDRRLVATLKGDWNVPDVDVAVSPDRKTIVTRDADTATMWHIENGESAEIATVNLPSYPENFGRIGGLPVFSDSSRHAAFGGRTFIRVVDCATGRESFAHESSNLLLDFRFAPDAERLAIVFANEDVLVVSLEEDPHQIAIPPPRPPAFVDFLEPDHLLIECDNVAVTYGLRAEETDEILRRDIDGPRSWTNGRIPADERCCWPQPGRGRCYLIAPHSLESSRLERIEGRAEVSTILVTDQALPEGNGHDIDFNSFESAAVSSDGKKIIGFDFNTERVIEVGERSVGPSGTYWWHRSYPRRGYVHAMAFGATNRFVTVTPFSNMTETTIWLTTPAYDPVAWHHPAGKSHCVAVSTNGERVIVGFEDDTDYDIVVGALGPLEISKVPELSVGVTHPREWWSSDLRKAARIDDSGVLSFWEPSTEWRKTELSGLSIDDQLAASGDLTALVGLSPERLLRRWDTSSATLAAETRLVPPSPTRPSPGSKFALSGDGRFWAMTWTTPARSGGPEVTFTVYDTRSGTQVCSRDIVAVNEIVFSPDARAVAVKEGYGSWLVFALDEPSTALQTVVGYADVTWSRDSQRLLAIDRHGVVQVTHLETRQQFTLGPRTGQITSADFTHDGNAVVTAGTEGTVRVWDIASRRELTRLDASDDGFGVTRVWATDDEIRVLTRPPTIRGWSYRDVFERAQVRVPSPFSQAEAEQFRIANEEESSIIEDLLRWGSTRAMIHDASGLSPSARRWALSRLEDEVR